ncbi:hypothetical protein VTJ49DRAFT_6207 [Mycothermus thermophilus]|uniref:Voltage-gated hydrogen channel 1 n=1 Tax=Humicola insolens TaxID=85995 RepID=A0ABR3V1M0_HUMIN
MMSLAKFKAAHARRRTQAQDLLSSHTKHYFILGLVALDVCTILADLLVALIACDLDKEDEPWVAKTREVLHPISITFSSLFMAELLVTVWAFGWRYFKRWFHAFDAAVIVTSFVVDLATRGLVEEIVSIVIVLRLFRLFKIIEEVSAGAAEQMEEVQDELKKLKAENQALRKDLEAARGGGGVEQACVRGAPPQGISESAAVVLFPVSCTGRSDAVPTWKLPSKSD